MAGADGQAPEPPELRRLRRKIDALDRRIVTLLNERADSEPRRERGERVLKNHLHAAAQLSQWLAGECADVGAVEPNRTRGGFN